MKRTIEGNTKGSKQAQAFFLSTRRGNVPNNLDVGPGAGLFNAIRERNVDFQIALTCSRVVVEGRTANRKDCQARISPMNLIQGSVFSCWRTAAITG